MTAVDPVRVEAAKKWAREDIRGWFGVFPMAAAHVGVLVDALEAAEVEMDGPSGLREQLVAARKGEQIEHRMRERITRERDEALDALRLGLESDHYEHPANGRCGCPFCQSARAVLAGSEPTEDEGEPCARCGAPPFTVCDVCQGPVGTDVEEPSA